MRTWMAAGTGLALLMGGVAMAQTPPAQPPPTQAPTAPPPPMDAGPNPGGPMEGMRHGGPMGGHFREMMMRMHGEHQSKAAHFRLRKGDARIDIKCADDEPTKACIDAASALLDKLAAQPK